MTPDPQRYVAELPAEELPRLAAALLARMLAPQPAPVQAAGPQPLLNAKELARHLNVPESWVRSEARAGHIPSVPVGRYVRFRLEDVEAALARKAA